jgi:diketogulonate reductase-like aldo/keto reductase
MKIDDYKLGQGTWMLGENDGRYAVEFKALSYGIQHGLTLIDTAEMYGEGRSEELIGDVIRPLRREDLFLVSKVYPFNASRDGMRRACTASLRRLGTDHLDLYLLHWPGSVPLEETVAGFEELKREGLIGDWGVSNFDVADMEELWSVPGGRACVTNQVLYNVGSRGIEFDLVPWMRSHGVHLMAYSPLAHSSSHQSWLARDSALRQLAQKHDASVFQIMLAFVCRLPDTVAIPRSGRADHVADNVASLAITLDPGDLALLDEAFPPPTRKMPLDIL